MCCVTVSIETGKQIPTEERNGKVGGGDGPAAVLKGVLVKDGLVAGNKDLLSLGKVGFVVGCQGTLGEPSGRKQRLTSWELGNVGRLLIP